ncbi:MAG: phosphomannomutase [Alphaproteobacteria bacterium]|nr:phosphomannomutase [Alphaproteobacteria bacterium]
MTAHKFHSTVLREYDVRGVVGKTLSEDDARAVGRGFGTMVRRAGGTTVCVGYDGRLSSPSLEAALADGLASCGLKVRRIGLGPTPMLYFSVHHHDADGGVMVTGSHNPPDYNGFKMMIGKKPFFGEQIQQLGRIAAAGDFAEGKGEVADAPVFDAYLDRLLRDYTGPAINAAWDTGNGAAGPVVKALVARLPGRHVVLNDTVDGTFPNHHPDPTDPETLHQLRAATLDNGLDLGLGFDGDGDRIGALDGAGNIVWGDQLLALLARDVLRDRPGATIVADVKSSQVLFDDVAAHGGKPLMWRTGHSLIKQKMAETGAPLAGEMSGHIFFAHRWYGFDDAIYAALRLLEAIGRSGESLETLRAGLPQMMNTPELRFPCDETRKFAVPGEIRQRLADTGVAVNDIDGVRVTNDDGWWLLRASNTQDVLVARCESASEEGLTRLKESLVAQLRQSGVAPPASL